LYSSETHYIIDAHNALIAKIVEETNFPAIWGSGLTLSASKGTRDCNELSYTQVLDELELMSDATNIPIFVDGDTGYGNFNNFRRFVKQLCRLGIAAVSIEDKIFPKLNSFLDRHQELADINEFCGRIKAGKDAQTNSDFSIVARTEAFICGKSLQEALDRASAYIEAGADAIIVHSKSNTANEVLEFAKCWNNYSPLIVIPTKYYQTPAVEFIKAKIAIVIWANHNLRAIVSAVRKNAQQIYHENGVINVENQIANLDEIFKLVRDDELKQSEQIYLNYSHIKEES